VPCAHPEDGRTARVRMVPLSTDCFGQSLARDVANGQGVVLVQEGETLTENSVKLLCELTALDPSIEKRIWIKITDDAPVN